MGGNHAQHYPPAPRIRRQAGKGLSRIHRAGCHGKLAPYGFVCTVHELVAKVGGKHRMSFRNFTTGESHSFGGTYVELVPGERLVYTDSFDDPNLPGEMKVTISLKAVSVGTEINIEQQGVPDIIPAEACYLGWQESLEKLKKLVEPEITR